MLTSSTEQIAGAASEDWFAGSRPKRREAKGICLELNLQLVQRDDERYTWGLRLVICLQQSVWVSVPIRWGLANTLAENYSQAKRSAISSLVQTEKAAAELWTVGRY